MSYEAEYESIMRHFAYEWQSPFNPAYPDISVAWPDIAFTPEIGKPFARINVLSGPEALVGPCGTGGAYRNAGVVSVQLFTPRGTGAILSRRMKDFAMSIFRGKTIGTVHIGNIETTDDIERPDSAFYGVSISFFYQRWEYQA